MKRNAFELLRPSPASAGSARKKSKGVGSTTFVVCPSCKKSIPSNRVNSHLDKCLLVVVDVTPPSTLLKKEKAASVGGCKINPLLSLAYRPKKLLQQNGTKSADREFPFDSAMYKGSFQMRKSGSRTTKIVDQQIVMRFRPNTDGSYNVYGKGINQIGEFNLLGTMILSGKTGGHVELYRMYPPEKLNPVKNSNFFIKADLVLLAMGFIHPKHDGVISDLKLKKDNKGNVLANEKDYITSDKKVFTAGDARRGQSLVVWAIREGREAAESIHNYLST